MEKFTPDHQLFLYESYVKCNNSARKNKRTFKRKFPWLQVHNRNTIHNLVNEVRITGMLTDMKPKYHGLLTEEKLGEIRAQPEQSPCKSLAMSCTRNGSIKKTARTATKLFKLWPYKTTVANSMWSWIQ
jgi:hypothetical protein